MFQPVARPRAPRAPRPASALMFVLALLASLAPCARAQGGLTPDPFWTPASPQQQRPEPAAPVAPAPAPPSRIPVAPGARVIARVSGHAITQEDFDRVGQPYFEQLRRQFGSGYTPELQRMANYNVLDELVRRAILAIEAERQKVVASQADVDSILAQDPGLRTNGRFDPAKLAAFQSGPASNYFAILPRLREMATLRKMDELTRRRCTPSGADLRAEWTKRNTQVRFQTLPLLTRDMPLDSEATTGEREAYFRAHRDLFTHKAQVHLHYLRVPLPAAGDSTRAAAEPAALALAREVADSLRSGLLPDTATRLVDSGPIEVPTTSIPALGRVPGLVDTLGLAETDASIRVVGPYVLPDGVLVGVVTGRQPRRPATLGESMADVKRRADAEKRRTVQEDERREFHAAHPDHWRGPRVHVTRCVLDGSRLAIEPPAASDVERWYAQHGRELAGLADTSRALPPLGDSLRAVVRARLVEALRPERTDAILRRAAAQLATTSTLATIARANGVSAETLSVFRFATPDSVFGPVFVDSLLASAPEARGRVQGPRALGPWSVVWRVDAVDTAYVPPYDAIRSRVDREVADEHRRQDEADGRAHYDAHRADYLTPQRYALDVISVRIPDIDTSRVSAAQVRRTYEAAPARFRRDEEVRARHILFSTRELGPGVDAIAHARADSVLAVIRKGGADFGELARRFSQDPGTAGAGGELGWFGRGRMVKEFEDGAFALQPGQVGGLVKTAFGYHIIQVEERHEAGTKTLAEATDEIRAQIAHARADSSAETAARALRAKLAAGGDAKALAAPYGGVVAAPPVTSRESVPNVGFVPDLGRDMTTMRPGVWAPRTYHTAVAYHVIRLRESIAPHVAAFDEARTQAIEDARNVRRRAVLERKVADVRAGLAAGASLDSLAALYGGLRDSGPLAGNAGFVPSIGAEPRLIRRALTLDPGAVSDTVRIGTGVAWVRVVDKPAPSLDSFKRDTPRLEAEMTQQRYADWLAERRKSVAIEILRADLRGPRPGAPN